jgi:hypothetical protein
MDRPKVVKMASTRKPKPVAGESQPSPFRTILDVARLLSSSSTPEKVIETVLSHLQEKLGKRARCALLDGVDLRISHWAGEYSCSMNGFRIKEDSIVWEVVRKGIPLNLTDPHQTNGYTHTLDEPIRIKAIIPLAYSDPLTDEKRMLGALIVDSGKEGTPISPQDFEYLQVIGELISAIAGRAELTHQLMTSCSRQESILMETAHNFRNSIAMIGGFSRRIVKLTKDKELIEEARRLYDQVMILEAQLADFEKNMSLKR